MRARFLSILLLIFVPPALAGSLPSGTKETVAPVVRAVTPGVVNIATRRIEQVDVPALGDPVLQEFFDLPTQRLRRETASAGSGVIVDAEHGYVLTNEHVVRDASIIEVTTKDGRKFRARLVGRDKPTDIAVLQIKPENLTSVPIGDSNSLEVGDFVLAIGNPFGLGQAVTPGIVSALGRTGLGIEGYEDFIQTDASINPGNSGGALVTLDGRLVGVNTAILSKSGASNGVGFAIPIDMARKVMRQILAHGEIQRGRIGVSLREPSNVTGRMGAEIAAVEPTSPADRAGLEKGDVIVAVDGKVIENPAQLRNLVGLSPVGTEVDVRYRRGAETGDVRVRIEAQQRSISSIR
jgi:Do/DeqQ family serine protease